MAHGQFSSSMKVTTCAPKTDRARPRCHRQVSDRTPTDSAPPQVLRALFHCVAFASRRRPVSPSRSSTIVTHLYSASHHAPLLQAQSAAAGGCCYPWCANASMSIGAEPRAKSTAAWNYHSHPSPPSSSRRCSHWCWPSPATLWVSGCCQELHPSSHEPTNDHCTALPSPFPPLP
jgi:hypothetical protein